MRTFTHWWGVQFVADNEIERELLRTFYERIEAGKKSYYEDGGIKLFTATKEHKRDWMFLSSKVNDDDLVLEINR